MTRDNILKLLSEGRKRLAKPRGWTKGHFVKKRGNSYGYCMLGALGYSAFQSPKYGPDAREYLRNSIYNFIRTEVFKFSDNTISPKCVKEVSITDFNDKCQSKKIILKVFDAAIKLRKEELKNKTTTHTKQKKKKKGN